MEIDGIAEPQYEQRTEHNHREYKKLLGAINEILNEDEKTAVLCRADLGWNNSTITKFLGYNATYWYYMETFSSKIGARMARYLQYRSYTRFLFWFFFRAMLSEDMEKRILYENNITKNNEIKFRTWYRDTTYIQAYILTYIFLGYSKDIIKKKLNIDSARFDLYLSRAIVKLVRRKDALSNSFSKIFIKTYT